MVKIFGWGFAFPNGWLYYWHWRRIFGWIISGNFTWIPTLISKWCILSAWHDAPCTSWVVVWILRGLEFITLSLLSIWSIPYSGGRWQAAETSSSVSMPFALGMYYDSYILTSEMSGWFNLLVTFVVWDSPILGVWFNLLQDSSGIGLSDDPVGFWLVYEFIFTLGNLLCS